MKTDSRELLAVGIFGRASLGDRIETLLKRGGDFSPRTSMTTVAAGAALLAVLAAAGSRLPKWIAFAEDRPSFEVASIKPGDPASRQVSMFMQPGGRYTTTNASLQMLIGFAYDVRDHQITGIPKALESARFTIDAKAPDGVAVAPPNGAAKIRLMVQSLLAERFKLAVHKETREEQVFELVADKGGIKMKEAANQDKGGPSGIRGGGRGKLTGMATPIPFLTNVLSQQLGRSVVDKTGLDAKYDFTLEWTPDPGAPGPQIDAGAPPDPNGPSLFTAVQEQLGLKLQSAKGPVELIVVDHAEMPTGN